MTMTKLVSLVLFTALVSLSACKKDDPITDPPGGNPNYNGPGSNILLIIADDMGIDASPNYPIGAVKPNMPNLMDLANQGITYDNVWANPLCSPTRASIITGRYGYRNGVLGVGSSLEDLPLSEKTLHEYLEENTNGDYAHSIIGKWHLGDIADKPTEMGIGYYAGLLKGALTDYWDWNYTHDGVTETNTEYATLKFTDLAISWINAQTKPWFCWLAYTTPHTPFHLPPDSMHSQGSLAPDQASIDANPLPYYMAMIETLDYEIGRIKNSMSASEWANTTVIFIGDNGTDGNVLQMPYASSHRKGTLFQGGVHVPMIIAGAGVNRSAVREEGMINTVDLFPTICEIAGINQASYEDAQSFKSSFDTPNSLGREYLYTELTGTTGTPGYAIRNDRYKMIFFDGGGRRMFDLQTDPYESVNLLSGTLSTEEIEARNALIAESNRIRS